MTNLNNETRELSTNELDAATGGSLLSMIISAFVGEVVHAGLSGPSYPSRLADIYAKQYGK